MPEANSYYAILILPSLYHAQSAVGTVAANEEGPDYFKTQSLPFCTWVFGWVLLNLKEVA